jgi:transglutaminase-like putative cysteine protease
MHIVSPRGPTLRAACHLSLPPGLRPGLQELTLAQAAEQLRQDGKSGIELVEGACALVAERIAYSRRSSYDSYATAFRRGYGYCSQQAKSLVDRAVPFA